MMHRKSPNNFKLLCPILNEGWNGRGSQPDKEDVEMVRSILSNSKGTGDITNGKNIKYRFSIRVPKHEFLLGDTLKVWMPVPIESSRQKNIKIHSVSSKNILQKVYKLIRLFPSFSIITQKKRDRKQMSAIPDFTAF